MTLIDLQNKIKQQLQVAAQQLFGVNLEQVSAETPPKPELGDLAFPISFELGKLIKQSTGTKIAPRAIAEQLKEKLTAEQEISRIEVAGAGYLNIFFDRAQLFSEFAAVRPPAIDDGRMEFVEADLNRWSSTPALIPIKQLI